MIRIVVDSSADYLAEELEERHLELVPLSIELNGRTYIDGKNMARNDFYKMMEETGAFPKTSQPSPQEFLDIFKDAKEKNDDVICVLLSSALSGTCQSALLAKQMADYERIFIVDSLSATFAIRMIVEHALKLINDGKSAEEIVAELETFKSHVKIIAAVDTLEYLARGGRISKAAAAVGELANLKPLVTISSEGKVDVIGKCLGKNKAIRALLTKFQDEELDTRFPIYSGYTYGTENCECFRQKLAQKGFETCEPLQIGSTIGTHVGPGAFGIVYVVK